MMNAETVDLEAAQKDVQRRLGRCMLRLQQYERLLKALLPNMTVAGPPEQLLAAQEERVACVRNKTLGGLVRQFSGEHLIAGPVHDGYEQGNGGPQSPAAGPWIDIRYSISLSPDAYEENKAILVELVQLRNELVHHLIERFDITNESGCQDASLYLDSCYERIDSSCQRLKSWATAVDRMRVKTSSFLQSEAFEQAFLHGINPDGTICWERSSVVEELCSAEDSCQIEGWTALDIAIRLIGKKDRAQVPSRYGCKTWLQLLKRSGQFDIKRVIGLNGLRRTWYRSRARD